MNIPLSFGSYKGRSGAANASVMANMMIEPDTHGGAAPYTAINTPGCLLFNDTGRVGEGRGGFIYPGTGICIIGKYVYYVSPTGGGSILVGTLNTSTGAVQFAENPTQVMIIDGTYGYVYTKSSKSLAQITDADFPIPKACTWKDGYGVVVAEGTGKLFASDINDFTSWGALSFTTAEYEPDNLVSVLAGHDSLFAFGEKTVQAYYNSGNTTFPFDNRQGANLQIGCGATNSPAGGENVVFWLDNTNVVRMLTGYSQQTISTDQIEYNISQLSSTTDARGFFYSQEGHSFYLLIFPSDNVTYAYDGTTQQWHTRTSYVKDGRWRAGWVAQEGSIILAGDYSNGLIYTLDSGTYQDNERPTRWFITSQNVNSDMDMIQHDLLELHIAAGVGLYDGQGDDPQLWMQYSDDDGNTWSREKWRSMGKIGEFSKRVRWHALGQSRSRVYRFGGSDPVKRHIISAHLKGVSLGY